MFFFEAALSYDEALSPVLYWLDVEEIGSGSPLQGRTATVASLDGSQTLSNIQRPLLSP